MVEPAVGVVLAHRRPHRGHPLAVLKINEVDPPLVVKQQILLFSGPARPVGRREGVSDITNDLHPPIRRSRQHVGAIVVIGFEHRIDPPRRLHPLYLAGLRMGPFEPVVGILLAAHEIVVAAKGVGGAAMQDGEVVAALSLVRHRTAGQRPVIPLGIQHVPGHPLQPAGCENPPIRTHRRAEATVRRGMLSYLTAAQLRIEDRMPAGIGARDHVHSPLPIDQHIAVLRHWRQGRAFGPLSRPEAPIDPQAQIVAPAQRVELGAAADDIGLVVAPATRPAAATQGVSGCSGDPLNRKFDRHRRPVVYCIAFHRYLF